MKTTGTRTAAATLAALVALTLGGCSGSEDTVAPSSGDNPVVAPDGDVPVAGLPDACALLSAGDIASVIDASYGEGVFNDQLSDAGQNICEWKSSDSPVKFIQVLVKRGNADQIAGERASAEDFMGDSSDVSVVGGSKAYTVAGGSILGMGVDGYFVQVSNMSTSTDDVTVQTVALAAIVAGNI